MSGLTLKRLGMIMEPRPGDLREVEGVLNPAAVRGPDGELYLFPRMVAAGNYSRIGIARVVFNTEGNPCSVERLGIALEPEAEYELRPNGGGGCEDPRVTFMPALSLYFMTYTAFSPRGPRIAFAVSSDIFHWKRLGLAHFDPCKGISSEDVDDKDSCLFPICLPDPRGRLSLTLLHRPLFPGTRPEETAVHGPDRTLELYRESIWISYCPVNAAIDIEHQPLRFQMHERLATPVSPWERLKIGVGTPPVLTSQGWLIIYHGVGGPPGAAKTNQHLRYSAGAMVLDANKPRSILYRSAEPLLTPDMPSDRHGTLADVIFPTGLDRRDDLGQPNRFDVYYGMGDRTIGVGRLDLPETLPTGVHSDAPTGTV
jgi:predicted GH43/DUF377 family glycosyl hydrolase